MMGESLMICRGYKTDIPCHMCKHYKEEQVDQFGYRRFCDKNPPDYIFLTSWGCYKFKKRKDDRRL